MKLSNPIPHNSIIPWMGGKRSFVSQIIPHIPDGITEVVSPFAGGLKVELKLASTRGVEIYAGDKNEALCNFYREITRDIDAVANHASVMLASIDAVTWSHYRDHAASSPAARAAQFYLLLKTSYGCRMKHLNRSVFESPTRRHRRFGWVDRFRANRDIVKKINYCRNVDFEETLDSRPHGFAYLDPPWPYAGAGHYEHVMSDSDHRRMFNCLRSRSAPWAVSYPYTDEITERYSGFRQVAISAAYSCRLVEFRGTRPQDKDILIMNY